MDSRRVFVIWIHPLFFESLRLLLKSADVQWIGSSHSSEKKYEEIHRLKPDTILIEEEENGQIPNNMLELMEAGSSNIRVFRLSLTDNDLQIYHREKRTVVQADDLLNLIIEGE